MAADIFRIREQTRMGITIRQIPLRVTFYARVSTEREEQASSLENQIAYYTDFICGNACWDFVEGYIDEGISGASTLKRNSFNRMIRDAKTGLFDLIITKEISRFSRNTVDSIQYTQELLRYGVGVLFQNDGINTFDPDGELRLTIMSGLAQDELRRLSERVRFGQKQSIKNGKVLGNDNMYGYDKQNGKLSINEDEAETVRLIFDLYVNRRLGLRKISEELYTRGIKGSRGNPFNTRTMANMINNPKYKGYYCGGKTSSIDFRTKKSISIPQCEWQFYRDESIPAIVPEELWNKANTLLKDRGSQLRKSGAVFYNRYAYSGKIVCGEHELSFQRQLRESGNEAWMCRVYREKGAQACTAPILYTSELNAVMSGIFMDEIKDKEKIILRIIKLISSSPEDRSYEREVARVNIEIAAVEERKDKLLELAVEEALSGAEFKKRNEALALRLEELAERKTALLHEKKKARDNMLDLPKIKSILERTLAFKDNVDSWLAASILDKIIVKNTGDKKSVNLEVHLLNSRATPVNYEKKRTSVRSCKA